MTAKHDTDGILRAFLQEGPDEMSQPLATRIRAEVDQTKQRTGLRPWRNLSMPRLFSVVAPLAALVVAILALLIGGVGGRPAPMATTSPSAVVAQSPSPTPSVSVGPSPYPLVSGEPWIVMGSSDRAMLIRPDGTGRHEILIGIGVSVNDPAWSPDGSTLVFDGNGSKGSQLWLANADGTDPRQLTPTPTGCPEAGCREAVQPAWSPDGRTIAYIAPEHVGGLFSKYVLMLVDVATGTTTEVYETTQVGLARPTWSPDSRAIAVEVDRYVGAVEASAIKDTTIGVIDLQATDETPRTITDPALLAGYPSWNPASDVIVFRTNRLDNGSGKLLDPSIPSELYTIQADGSRLTRLTRYGVGGSIVRAPSWTPDGRILFTTHDPTTGAERLRIVDANGKNEASATGLTDTDGQGRWRPGT